MTEILSFSFNTKIAGPSGIQWHNHKPTASGTDASRMQQRHAGHLRPFELNLHGRPWRRTSPATNLKSSRAISAGG